MQEFRDLLAYLGKRFTEGNEGNEGKTQKTNSTK
jgi:hypothetical protein